MHFFKKYKKILILIFSLIVAFTLTSFLLKPILGNNIQSKKLIQNEFSGQNIFAQSDYKIAGGSTVKIEKK